MRIKYALGLFALAITGVCQADWRYPHGDSANTGFASTTTAPAGAATRVDQVGELAAGAGPVVGPDGTVYVGNLSGMVQAYSADGTFRWSRQLLPGQWVTSSPVIGADGSVYVVADARFPVQDIITNIYRYESMLYKFSAAGDWLFQAPLPVHWGNTPYSSRGDANATPNLWTSNGIEAVIVPAVYSKGDGTGYNSLRLIAFSTQGVMLGDSLVKEVGNSMVIYGSLSAGPNCDWWNLLCWFGLPVGFHSSPEAPCTDLSTCLPLSTGYAQIGAAIWESGPTPTIVVSDGLNNMVGFTFDPAHGFRQTLSITDGADVRTSTPMILPDGHSLVGVTTLGTGLTVLRFGSPNPAGLSPISGFGPITGSITRLSDGRLVAIERAGLLRLANNNTITGTLILRGKSVAPASASSNFLYVSSAGALATFDVHTLTQVNSFGWSGGGRSSPAIGPAGQVYAVAGTEMYVWPPPQSTVVSSVQLHVMMSGTGSITSSPAGISCSYHSIRCISDFVMGSQVVLQAAGLTNPNTHDEYDFDYWEGACAGSGAFCSVLIDQAKTAKAVFVKVGNSGA